MTDVVAPYAPPAPDRLAPSTAMATSSSPVNSKPSSSSRGSLGPIRTLGGTARMRVTRACDLCHKKGNKCSPSAEPGICERCLAAGASCTYERPAKRRGPAPGFKVSSRSPVVDTSLWSPSTIADADVIEALVGCYHDIVYPIFCFFHWPAFVEKVRNRVYLSDRAFFASVMTVCSIASGRLRDGASLSRVRLPEGTLQLSDEFYRAAEEAIPTRLEDASHFEYVRATALLAITSIQQGDIQRMQQHLGNYITLSTTIGLCDERRWPTNITAIEVEERRRLFWSIYTLDVYASVVWGGVTRSREAQSLVAYPTEVDDEFINERYADVRAQPAGTLSWMRGWNFVTDLYRLLEHAIDHSRSSRSLDRKVSRSVSSIYCNNPSPRAVLDLVGQMYDSLHPRFKQVYPVKYQAHEDRFSFQSANIRVTMQTVEMVVLGNDTFSVEARCKVGAKLLNDMRRVPAEYLQATSTPLLHHLAGIGQFLGEVVQGPFLRESFLQVRDVLLSLADFLADLESNLRFAAGAAARLKTHVTRIDEYMAAVEAQGGSRAGSPLPHPFHDARRIEQQPSYQHQQQPQPTSAVTYPSHQHQIDVKPQMIETSNPPAHHPNQYVPPPPPIPSASSSELSRESPMAPPPPVPEHDLSPHSGSHISTPFGPASAGTPNGFDPTQQGPNSQYQLPAELLSEWPYDLGQGAVFPDLAAFGNFGLEHLSWGSV